MDKQPIFKTIFGKIILIFAAIIIVLSLVVNALYYSFNAVLDKSTPAIIKDYSSSANVSKIISNKIGKIKSETIENEYNLKKDTLKFTIRLAGEKASVKINAVAIKKAQEWQVVRSDTVFAQ